MQPDTLWCSFAWSYFSFYPPSLSLLLLIFLAHSDCFFLQRPGSIHLLMLDSFLSVLSINPSLTAINELLFLSCEEYWSVQTIFSTFPSCSFGKAVCCISAKETYVVQHHESFYLFTLSLDVQLVEKCTKLASQSSIPVTCLPLQKNNTPRVVYRPKICEQLQMFLEAFMMLLS